MISASITYTGNEDTPEAITAFGVAFVRNQPVTVTDAHAIRKLSTNSHFSVTAQSDDTIRKIEITEAWSTAKGGMVPLPPIPEIKRRGRAKVSDGG